VSCRKYLYLLVEVSSKLFNWLVLTRAWWESGVCTTLAPFACLQGLKDPSGFVLQLACGMNKPSKLMA